jgi:ParB/RepB/Spo0J family partition protein
MFAQVDLKYVQDNPWQTRTTVDSEHVVALAEDIRRNGLMQAPAGRLVDDTGNAVSTAIFLHKLNGAGTPLSIESRSPGGFTSCLTRFGYRIQLAFGHNRLYAYRHLAPTDEAFAYMPIHIQDLTDEEMAIRAWSENAQRKDTTPLEDAKAMQRMLDSFEWTHAQLADHLGVARSSISLKLRLLEAAPEVQEAVNAGRLSERAAQAMIPLNKLPEPARQLLQSDDLPSWLAKPDELLRRAINGSYDSDQIRNGVDHLLEGVTRSLDENDLPWSLDFDFSTIIVDTEEMQHPRCDACVVKLQRRKTARCGDIRCMDRKKHAFETRRLSAVSEGLGVPIRSLEEKEAGWSAYQEISHYGHLALAEQIISGAGCPHDTVRLELNEWTEYPGLEDKIGAGKRCKCFLKINREESKSANDRERKRITEVQDQVIQPAVKALCKSFATGDEKAWRLLIHHITGQDPAGQTMAEMRDTLSRGLVEKWAQWCLDDKRHAQRNIEERFTMFEVESPWAGESEEANT